MAGALVVPLAVAGGSIVLSAVGWAARAWGQRRLVESERVLLLAHDPPHAPQQQDAERPPRPEWLPRGVNWAICGETGVGKSTLINTLRDLLPKHENAAKVGVEETTKMPPESYELPSLGGIARVWDLPGAGTINVPDGDAYVSLCGLRYMNGVIVVTRRPTTRASKFIALLQRHGIPLTLVQTHIDTDITENLADNEVDAATTLKKLREGLQRHMSDAGGHPDRVYLAGKLKDPQVPPPGDLDRLIEDLNRRIREQAKELRGRQQAVAERQEGVMRLAPGAAAAAGPALGPGAHLAEEGASDSDAEMEVE